MVRRRSLVVRDEALAAVVSAIEDMVDAGGLAVVQGDGDSRKTSFLSDVARTWRNAASRRAALAAEFTRLFACLRRDWPVTC
ncbi:hypothetical protein [Kutzneria buriramensis]|uniref:Uncharacterized protein n=1 Tax=Kutzneria buriramensis TaxID=1045776 RepID=A0A3E0G7H0_9PSEU|nr:hypothetical protein [Kutzneria buriramensis]REH17899.1 hypothetical protein BCF44_14116 [Kutzneria buriramensis]